jgi:hypothetical protein
MRSKLPLIFAVFLLPLVLGWGVARAADQQDVGGFKLLLTDGSQVNGAVSLVINLDTPYGQIRIPSSSLVSAQFDVQQKWADIQLNDAQLKLRYNPASSDLKATTAVGSLTFALANVIKVARGSAEVPNGTSPQAAANQNTAANQGNVPQPPPATVAPPTVVYQYPYQYVSPAPYYYSPSYYYSPYYWPGPYIEWPYIGIGIGWGRGFGWGGFHGGFGRGR